MTNQQISPLPPHFNAGGYKITAVLENGPDYYVYQALSPEGQTVLILSLIHISEPTRP